MERLKARKTETDEELALRIATARKELKRVEAFDYVVINHENKLDETVDTVLADHQCRTSPRQSSRGDFMNMTPTP